MKVTSNLLQRGKRSYINGILTDKMKFKGGYTLVELMIATAVIGVLAVVATGLFFATSRGGSKVQVTVEVNQNGEIALGTMGRLVRNSLSVVGCTATESASLTVVDRNGREIRFSCEEIGTDYGYIASNGARLTSENVALSACAFACQEDAEGFRPASVDIDFSLRQAGPGLAGETEEQKFSTSVSLRNY